MNRRALMVVFACGLAIWAGGCRRPAAQPPTTTEVQQFQDAVRDGDAAIVDRLLSAKPGLANARGETGETPLAVAQRQGNEELVQVLKRHGAR